MKLVSGARPCTKTILSVSPHADDVELGCGGYLARRAREGAEIRSLVMSTSTIEHPHGGKVTSQTRMDEAFAAADVLGMASVERLFEGKDSLLDTIPLRELIDALVGKIAEYQPCEILIPLPSSHQDHVQTYKACIAATRPTALPASVKMIAAYEYPTSGWGEGASEVGKGGRYVELDEELMEKKAAALACYKSQMREGFEPYSIRAARALAHMRGMECGLEYAELLHVVRSLQRLS